MNTICHIIRLCSIGLMLALTLASCGNETFDANHPDVSMFVNTLKAGHYPQPETDATPIMPKFTEEDIAELLNYVEDLTLIPSFPLAPISYSAGGKLRLGECVMWTIESIRLGHNASMGCKMVHLDADDYEGIYFLTDEEVLDAAARYRRWWEERKYPRTAWTIDPCHDDPLCGSNYRWW